VRRTLPPWLIVVAAALAYGLAHFNWYAATPLGQVPVLDEKENLTLAAQVFGGTLPPEPFYRAMGYPLLLAGVRFAGATAGQLPLAALLVGVVLHALSALLIARLAQRWFDDDRAGAVAGLLAAFNPVFVDSAMQRLDGTLGMVLFVAGLVCLALERDRPARWQLPAASVWWSLAVLTRPQYLTFWLILPFAWVARHRTRGAAVQALLAVVVGAAPFLAEGLWQRSVGGEFRILPWQGAYNLWAANRPGSNGRYYQQSLNLAYSGQSANPARQESGILYRMETGRTQATIDEMNAYWRQRFLGQVVRHPITWFGLLVQKTYALLNDWEQYNNKTYAFHKALSPWLRFNPLGWGVLLVLGVAGAWRLQARDVKLAGVLALIAAAGTAGVLIFYVSGRFRLPLAALLCASAGGALARPLFWRQLPLACRRALAATLLVAGLITFSAFAGVRDHRTIVQDHLLVASAAQAVGDDDEAWSQALAALSLDPSRVDADEFVVTSGFNRLITGDLPESDFAAWHVSARRLLAVPAAGSPDSRVTAALLERDAGILRASAGRTGAIAYNALGALQLLGLADETETARLASAPWDTGGALFLMARQTLNPEAFAAWLNVQPNSTGRASVFSAARQRLLTTDRQKPER
jgi:Dolichyl-phosphate-mannose-protein mannosyltransferase